MLFNAAEAAARITLTREMLRSLPARFGAHAAAAATSLDALSTLEMRDLALAKRCHLRHSAQLSGQGRARCAVAGGRDAHRRSSLFAPLLMHRPHTMHSSRSDISMGEAPSTA